MYNDKFKKKEKKGNYNSSIKKFEENKKRNEKMKFKFNLSDYFKLIKHKNYSNFTNKKTNISTINKAGKSIKNNKSINQKSKENLKIVNKDKKSKEKILQKNNIQNSDKKEQKENINKNNINIKMDKPNSKKFKSKQLNKVLSEKMFNKRLNKQKSAKLKLPSTNNTTIKKPEFKKLIRTASCKNFNNSQLINHYNFEIKKNEKEENDHDIGNYLELSKYEEKKRNRNKFQYYNESNNYYIYTRRQQVEDYLNKMYYDEYKILQPLRMTSRIFFNEEDIETNNNEQSDNNIANNLFFSKCNKKNNYIKTVDKFFFNDSMKYNNNCDKKPLYGKNLINYYKKVKQISASRKDLFTKEFFEKKEYSLLDFDFSFINKKKKKKKKKSHENK